MKLPIMHINTPNNVLHINVIYYRLVYPMLHLYINTPNNIFLSSYKTFPNVIKKRNKSKQINSRRNRQMLWEEETNIMKKGGRQLGFAVETNENIRQGFMCKPRFSGNKLSTRVTFIQSDLTCDKHIFKDLMSLFSTQVDQEKESQQFRWAHQPGTNF